MSEIMEETLLNLIMGMIEKPLASLDYDRPLEEIINDVDGFIDSYLLVARKLVEVHLIKAYQDGVSDATKKLNNAAGHDDVGYKPVVPDRPEKLDFLIGMHQCNVEDYALVLRGRLRSAIESRMYLEL